MFNFLLYRPLLNLLVWISEHLVAGDFGFAVIILTVIVRLLLFPFFHKSLKDQRIMAKIQAEREKIEKQYKNDQEKQVAEIMHLYKENKVNPFLSFLLLFIQLPLIYALYKVIVTGINGAATSSLYSFIVPITTVNYMFLGLINLKEGNTIMFGLVLLAQFVQGLLAAPGGLSGKISPDLQKSRKTAINTNLVLTAFVALFLWKLPAALGLYWLTSTVFGGIQQLLVNNLHERDGEPKRNN